MTGRPRRRYDLAGPVADYPEWKAEPRASLVLCTQQRSGSTLLGEALYFAGTCGCPVEYFAPGFRPGFEARWATADPHAYVAALHRHRTDPSGVFAVKLFWSDVEAIARDLDPTPLEGMDRTAVGLQPGPMYRRLLTATAWAFPHPTFVHLTRRDELRQAVSTAVAGRTGAWRRLSSDGRGGRRPAGYDFDHIVQRLAEIQNDNRHWINFYLSNGIEPHRVEYEALAADYDGTVRRLLDALGRQERPVPRPRLLRQADETSESLVQRFKAEFARRAGG